MGVTRSKSTRFWVGLALLLATLLVDPAVALAQRPQRYQPTRPTVSPYLNLLRRNNSVTPNYYSFVRPVQRQIAINQQQLTFQTMQTAELQRLQASVMQAQSGGPVTGSSSWFQNPGTRSTYLNTSGYYSRVGGR